VTPGSGSTARKTIRDARKRHYQIYLASRVAAHEQPSLRIESQTSGSEAASWTLRIVGIPHYLGSGEGAAGRLAVGPEVDTYDTVSVRRRSVPVDRERIGVRQRSILRLEHMGCNAYQLPWSDTKAALPSATNLMSSGAVCAGSTTLGASKYCAHVRSAASTSYPSGMLA